MTHRQPAKAYCLGSKDYGTSSNLHEGVYNVLLANTVGVSRELYHLLSNDTATKIIDKPDERTAAKMSLFVRHVVSWSLCNCEADYISQKRT